MTKREIEELNELARRILIICAQAQIDNQKYQENAEKVRKTFSVVTQKKEGYKE